ncbi:MAG: ATP-binding protein [Cytophagales bacterium]|nr:MAG: ATP-binding protein [Cytophagales bacterium]
MVNRLLVSKATELLEKYPILSINGPRQSGKTTLCRLLRPDYVYLNMELPQNRQFAEQDPNGFLETYKGGVILDEVQTVPSLFSYLQYYTDLRNQPGEYILSGSQDFLLLEQITQSLAGRVALFTLLPFALNEINSTEFAPTAWADYLWRGSYPRLYDRAIAPADFYPNYVTTYVERDVRQVVNVQNVGQFGAFLVSCASRIGQLVNFAQLGLELGLDAKTVARWVSVLETSFIAYQLQPYFRNYNKRLVKSPKLYFYDTGLACSLLGIRSVEQLQTHFLRGALFENLLINELTKNKLNVGERPQFYFWRDSTGHEIDLLSDEGIVHRALEIKSGQTIQPAFFEGLSFYANLPHETETVKSYLVYGGNDPQRRTAATVLTWQTLSEFST